MKKRWRNIKFCSSLEDNEKWISLFFSLFHLLFFWFSVIKFEEKKTSFLSEIFHQSYSSRGMRGGPQWECLKVTHAVSRGLVTKQRVISDRRIDLSWLVKSITTSFCDWSLMTCKKYYSLVFGFVLRYIFEYSVFRGRIDEKGEMRPTTERLSDWKRMNGQTDRETERQRKTDRVR